MLEIVKWIHIRGERRAEERKRGPSSEEKEKERDKMRGRDVEKAGF